MSEKKEQRRANSPQKRSRSADSPNKTNKSRCRKETLPFPARLACFWPLAVVPPLAVFWAMKRALPGIAAAFVCNSLLTVLFYREDKRLAEHQGARIPEFYLHLWELACGWPGALYAQRRFRHKLKKLSYMVVFWLYVILNLVVVTWIVSPEEAKSHAEEFIRRIPDCFRVQ